MLLLSFSYSLNGFNKWFLCPEQDRRSCLWGSSNGRDSYFEAYYGVTLVVDVSGKIQNFPPIVFSSEEIGMNFGLLKNIFQDICLCLKYYNLHFKKDLYFPHCYTFVCNINKESYLWSIFRCWFVVSFWTGLCVLNLCFDICFVWIKRN